MVNVTNAKEWQYVFGALAEALQRGYTGPCGSVRCSASPVLRHRHLAGMTRPSLHICSHLCIIRFIILFLLSFFVLSFTVDQVHLGNQCCRTAGCSDLSSYCPGHT